MKALKCAASVKLARTNPWSVVSYQGKVTVSCPVKAVVRACEKAAEGVR